MFDLFFFVFVNHPMAWVSQTLHHTWETITQRGMAHHTQGWSPSSAYMVALGEEVAGWPQSGSVLGDSQYMRQSPTVLLPHPQYPLLHGPMGAIQTFTPVCWKLCLPLATPTLGPKALQGLCLILSTPPVGHLGSCFLCYARLVALP